MALTGRTAVGTGFGWGIGSAIAASLAKTGCSIVGTYRSLSESVKENMEKIKEMLAIV